VPPLEVPTDFELPRSRFDELLGTEWVSDDPERAVARIGVRDELRQPVGLIHGGVFSSVIESLCSRATALAVLPDGMIAMGQAISVSFVRSLTEGGAEVVATARHRGRSTWVWDVDVTDEAGRLCATAQMTIAVRPLPQAVIDRYSPPETAAGDGAPAGGD